MPVVEAEMEAVEVLPARGADLRDQRLRRHAFGFRLQHDRRAVRVVGTHEMDLVSLHPLEAHPDIAWMYSMMCPMWNGPLAYGSAVVTNSVRGDTAGDGGFPAAGIAQDLEIGRGKKRF